MQDRPANAPPELKIESRQAFPLVTCLLITCLVFGYMQVSQGGTNDRFFVTQGYGIDPYKAWSYLILQKWQDLGKMLWGTFASIHVVQFFANMYFFWVFANHVEQKMGIGRALVLVAVGILVPWLVLAWDLHNKPSPMFFGPAFLLCSLVGAYLAVPPDKQKLKSWMPKPRSQIFNKETKKDITESYNRDPMIYVILFIVAQIGFHFAAQGSPLFPGLFPKYDNISLLPAFIALGLGYGMAIFLLVAAVGSVKDAPMKLSVLRHYRSLIAIDVPHEQALMGTAKATGLPYEQVREWVSKEKGRMRVS